MKHTFFFILLLYIANFSVAQEFEYVPSRSKLPSKKKFEERIEANFLADVAALEGNIKNKKAIEELYVQRKNLIYSLAVDEGEYIFDTPLNHYVETVFKTILDQNPKLNQERLQLLVSRDIAPNMSSFGEGTIVINIGLIRHIENESQLAFLLAHELSHFSLNHINQAIIEAAQEKNRGQSTSLIHSDNNQGLSTTNFPFYSSSKHTRLHEFEADKEALSLLKTTGYDTSEASTIVNLLNTIDEEKYNHTIVLHKEFNRQLYPFKPSWKEEENPLQAFFDKENQLQTRGMHQDSLNTHSNTLTRAKKINDQVKENANGNLFLQPESIHQKAIQQADFEVILSGYHYKDYGFTIYQSLQLQKLYPGHPFLTGIIGVCMGEMVKAINKHELGKILPMSSPEKDDNYNDLLAFLNNLSMDEMKEVAWNYVAIYQDRATESEALAYALALTAKEKKKNELKTKYKSLFMKHFTNSYFMNNARKL